MFRCRQTTLPILVILLSALLPSTLIGFTSGESIGTVKVTANQAWVERKGERLEIGSFGQLLQKDDLVKTDRAGRAQISLNNGNTISLAPHTELAVTEELIGDEEDTGLTQVLKLFYGKVRAKVQKTRKQRFLVKTATATIGVKGTDFITLFVDEKTTVGTVAGLVNLLADKTKDSVDIPPGAMASVSVFGELMPLEEFAGELMEGVEFAGEQMTQDDIAGEKITP